MRGDRRPPPGARIRPRWGRASDETLAQRVQQGNAEAFEELARRYMHAIDAVVASYLGETADVEDATQETFLRALDRIATFDASRRFAPWLYQIARNVARNRREKLSRLSRQESIHPEQPGLSPDPLAVLEKEEARRLVRAAMGELPEQQRTAFRLFDVEGLRAPEIAKLMGLTEGTVRSHVHHARRRMRAYLAPLLNDERVG